MTKSGKRPQPPVPYRKSTGKFTARFLLSQICRLRSSVQTARLWPPQGACNCPRLFPGLYNNDVPNEAKLTPVERLHGLACCWPPPRLTAPLPVGMSVMKASRISPFSRKHLDRNVCATAASIVMKSQLQYRCISRRGNPLEK